MSGCETCHASGHNTDGHIAEAFTNPVTREPYDVPEDIKRAATRIVQAYGIRGICDPMYIANIIARELGCGDGESHFWNPGVVECDACGRNDVVGCIGGTHYYCTRHEEEVTAMHEADQ